jgi:protein gp37
MSATTTIEWTDRTWNPVTGCTEVSAGCDHCYAKTMHERFNGPGSFATVTVHDDRLAAPLGWRSPAKVFVNSMSDLFHASVTDEQIARVWAVMALAPRHTFQILTKRHGRMRSLLSSGDFERAVGDVWIRHERRTPYTEWPGWPLPNVWLGVSAETQPWADIRIPALLHTPAAVRWVSAEPLLGPLDLTSHLVHAALRAPDDWLHGLDWVVVGGESGRGARPMDPTWARHLRDQCAAADVPFLFKQWGAHGQDGFRRSKKANGRHLDGRLHDAYPDTPDRAA